MVNSADKSENSDAGLYPIRTVSDLTGVNAITLRAWERRHGFFKAIRTASGHRMYTQEHIDLITRVVGLLDHGMRIGQVKAKLEAEEIRSEAQKADFGKRWKRYLDRMISAVIQFDEVGLEETYDEALSLYTVDTVTKNLLAPMLTEIGRRWLENTGSVAEEHFFGFYLRNKLGARFHHRFKKHGGAKIMLSCLPGDRHETGLLMFALAASNAGYQTIMLGADMPIDELPAAAKKTNSEAIVLSGLVKPPDQLLCEELPRLKQAVRIPIFLGGRASKAAHDALRKAGITPLGTNLETGLQRICETVPVSSRG